MYRMHVGNLPWRLSDEQLRKLFGTYGTGEARPRRIVVSAPDRVRPIDTSSHRSLGPAPAS
jgi:RNA recognition motif-containing protein